MENFIEKNSDKYRNSIDPDYFYSMAYWKEKK